jgi:hypothetical protein
VADRLGVGTRDMLMVAAHPWDLLGAARAGCRTAFLARPGKAMLPGVPAPEYMPTDLRALVDQLISRKDAERPYQMTSGAEVPSFLFSGYRRWHPDCVPPESRSGLGHWVVFSHRPSCSFVIHFQNRHAPSTFRVRNRPEHDDTSLFRELCPVVPVFLH